MLPLTPTKLGRYEIVDEIGKGAMGVVYLARDPLIGRLVALKTFRIGYSVKDAELDQFRARFIREAQSAGILSHPNIVTIHDVVERSAEGLAFIAMEYVRGTNLKLVLQEDRRPTLPYVTDIVSQIADALDYAHSCKVVHRDVKPANILITSERRVKITDFGIARLDTSNLTQEGQLLGTPNYMAPEQILGREVDHRADLFSLGVVLYEMLTRHKPFQGENLTVVSHRIVYDNFTPPRDYISDLPAGVEPVIQRALEKDPVRRYQRARDLADDLRRVLGQVSPRDPLNETQSLSATAVVMAPRQPAAWPAWLPSGADSPTVPTRGAAPGAGLGGGHFALSPSPAPGPPGSMSLPAELAGAFAAGGGAGSGQLSAAEPASGTSSGVAGATASFRRWLVRLGVSRQAEASRQAMASAPAGSASAAAAPAGSAAAQQGSTGEPQGSAAAVQRGLVAGALGAAGAEQGSAGGTQVSATAPPPGSAAASAGAGFAGAQPGQAAAPASRFAHATRPAPVPAFDPPPATSTITPDLAAPGAPAATPAVLPAALAAPLRAGPFSTTPARAITFAALTVVVAALAAGSLLFWAHRQSPPSHGAAAAARDAGAGSGPFIALLQEARRLLDSGDPRGAAAAYRNAEQLAPERASLHRLREEAERRAGEHDRRLDQERAIAAKLEEARKALAERHFEPAEAAAQMVLQMSAGNTAAQQVLADVQAARQRFRERLAASGSRAAAAARAQEAAASAPAPGTDPAAARLEPQPGAAEAAKDATLQISFFSQLPQGTLMLYLNGKRVLLESFRFYEKGTLFRLKPKSGAISRSFPVPPGTADIRVYVTPQGRAAEVRNLSGNFLGGTTRSLDIKLSESGQLSATLN